MLTQVKKTFECDVCEKRFTRQCYLQRHKHSHTGEKRSRVSNVEQRTHVVLMYRDMCVLNEIQDTRYKKLYLTSVSIQKH